METILTICIVGTLNIACFFIGSKLGQTVAKGEKIEMPSVSLSEAIQKQRERKQAEAEKSRLDTILQNIERYDGTNAGQKEVPRG